MGSPKHMCDWLYARLISCLHHCDIRRACVLLALCVLCAAAAGAAAAHSGADGAATWANAPRRALLDAKSAAATDAAKGEKSDKFFGAPLAGLAAATFQPWIYPSYPAYSYSPYGYYPYRGGYYPYRSGGYWGPRWYDRDDNWGKR
ncbi:hypothetical protein MNEG_1685 [Monoraphidium neglectum]|uniref:Transmembrane protein n=1 Tax=Monoraphidium neglectum TaxID=145388 RepID=A0A0D2N179_9CHLO|nr:hypothetical protein MNEG_1685 [Monoraphidium neglectum]KIZ06282.1 hypothetical protein MNEG_1685 [Monoraphidium neglectum]|eukprot:XP_013905301.1 hypothetical protein MNEG_1685 [Monoraphidium neglectum]